MSCAGTSSSARIFDTSSGLSVENAHSVSKTRSVSAKPGGISCGPSGPGAWPLAPPFAGPSSRLAPEPGSLKAVRNAFQTVL